MTENIKTILIAVIAVALLSHTVYKITADSGGSASTTASSSGSMVPLSTTDNGPTVGGVPKAEPVTEPAKPALPPTSITFKESSYDFGEMTAGDREKHIFEFVNTGQNPLVISNARGSCGCTVPSWSKEPIAPGESGNIEVEYNSTGKKGAVQQVVTIDANTNPSQSKLTIKVQVNPAEEPEG